MKWWSVRLGVAAVGSTVLALVLASAASADYQKSCFTDTSDSVTACFWQDFLYDGTGYDVTNYHFELTRHDSTVQITKAVVHAGVLGKSESGTSYNEATSKTWTSPSTGVNHFLTPSWSGVYIVIPDGSTLYQCGNLFIDLQRGGTTWSFHTPHNLCIGDLFAFPPPSDR
jgi:hypothetical protein